MRVFLGFVAYIAVATSLTFAAPQTESAYKVKEEISIPPGWLKHSKPSPDHLISLRIGLPQPNFPVLEKHLYEVSDPEHERYGQHLSKEEVEALVAPHVESLDSVNDWLAGFGLQEADLSRSPAKDWVLITLPVSMVEKLLDTVRIFLSCGGHPWTLLGVHLRSIFRPTTSGNTSGVAKNWSGPPASVFRATYMAMWM